MLLIGLAPTTCPAQPVSRETARQAAKTFLDNNGAATAELSDMSAAAGFAQLYVFSTSHSFVLMAADSRVQPVLGYSLNGGFDIEGMPDNKRAWIKEYGDGIQFAIDHQTRASAETTRQWRALLDGDPDAGRAITEVTPLITTQWNQGSPYNLLCPSNSVTGCVATAMAQVMKYWDYPEHGIGSHSYVHYNYGELSADFQNTAYDWDNMTDTYNSSSTQAEKMAVATLMYHCGVAVDMDYSPSGSGAGAAIVAEALKNYFNYSSEVAYHNRSEYDDDVWIGMLKADLDLERPIWYCGSGSDIGHAFVFDGYNDDDYFHVNWGWGGSCDEYYLVNNLNPGPGGIGSGAYGVYNESQGAIFGVHPSECTAGTPTDLTYTQNEREVTLSWTTANNAASYNVYCNGNLVGNTSETSYVHLAPFGSAVYYVRSMDANGALSLSSNVVEATIPYPVPQVTDLTATANGYDVHLNWTAPEWCYPETATTFMTYGDGDVYYLWTSEYYGHRYPADDLTQYANKAVYKVSTYIEYPGTYSLYIYTQASGSQPDPASLAASKTDIPVSLSNCWYEFTLDAPVLLTGTDDLWVVIGQANTGQTYPSPSFNLDSYNADACYDGYSPTALESLPTDFPISWFIRTYLTDGTYTYNLYRDGTAIASDIDGTQYTDSNRPDGTYAYYVKTNYYGGETEASNTVTVTVPGLFTQTVDLNAGWTWWTPTVVADDLLSQLEAALGGNGILINSQGNGFARYEVVDDQGSWSGTLTGVEPGQMYKAKATAAGTITLEGEAVQNNGVTILPGYNWFGYTGTTTTTIATALGSNFTPANNDTITDEDGHTATYNGTAWEGNLTNLVPGKGYVYHSHDATTKTITF